MIARIVSLLTWCAVGVACAFVHLGFRANERAAVANLEAARLFSATFEALLRRADAADLDGAPSAGANGSPPNL